MMCGLVMAAGLIVGQVQGGWGSGFAGFTEAAGQLVPAIAEHGYQRVAVLPYLAVSSEDPQPDAAGGLKALGNFLASSLRRGLAEQAAGRFQVLEGDQVNNVLFELQPGRLGQPENIRRAAERLGGVDAIVIGTARDLREPGRGRPGEADLVVRCQLVETRQGNAVAEARQDLFVSIAGAAYAGESFELRRWEGGALKNVGLHPRSEDDWVAPNDFYARGKYKDICRRRPHPLADDGCPFRMAVLVDDVVRPPVAVGRDYFVRLEAGDTFAVRIDNRCGHDVYMALFVDGINVLGKQAEHPANCRYWNLAAHDYGIFSGWYTADDNRYLEESFRLGQADDSVAVRLGHLGKLGQLTAVFYTTGQPKPEQTFVRKEYEVWGRVHSERVRMPDGRWGMTAPADPPEKRVAVLAGPKRVVDLETHYGQAPGLILAAITLQYASAGEIERLRSAPVAWTGDPDHVDPAATPWAPDTSVDLYAAIAFSKSTWGYGYAHGYRTQEEASDEARRRCGEADAEVVASCANGWCALAFGARHSAWGASAGTVEQALAGAENTARGHTSQPCHVEICFSSSGEKVLNAAGDDAPSRPRRSSFSPRGDSSRGLRFGMTGQRTGRSAQYGGVEVAMVVPGSPATKLRGQSDGKTYYLAPGRDIITHVNGQPVTTNEELVDAVRRSSREMTIRVYDLRTQSSDDYDVTLRD